MSFKYLPFVGLEQNFDFERGSFRKRKKGSASILCTPIAARSVISHDCCSAERIVEAHTKMQKYVLSFACVGSTLDVDRES